VVRYQDPEIVLDFTIRLEDTDSNKSYEPVTNKRRLSVSFHASADVSFATDTSESKNDNYTGLFARY
jgi:hypothetical protein